MFKVEKVMVPDIVSTLFDKTSNVHNHYTRQSQQLFVFRVSTNALAGTIRVRGVNIWNTITTKTSLNWSHNGSKNYTVDSLIRNRCQQL